MNNIKTNGTKSMGSVWERLIIQIPALAALIGLGYITITFWQDMDRTRLEKGVAIDTARIEALRELGKAIDDLARNEEIENDISRSLLTAITATDTNAKAHHDALMVRLKEDNVVRQEFLTALTTVNQLLSQQQE